MPNPKQSIPSAEKKSKEALKPAKTKVEEVSKPFNKPAPEIVTKNVVKPKPPKIEVVKKEEAKPVDVQKKDSKSY